YQVQIHDVIIAHVGDPYTSYCEHLVRETPFIPKLQVTMISVPTIQGIVPAKAPAAVATHTV
ncbi:MAG: hypothetical protein VXY54_04215, partial [Pseudomonadota bacterium]|nr:hypothetical protein [Pseudomonadota bacterium]